MAGRKQHWDLNMQEKQQGHKVVSDHWCLCLCLFPSLPGDRKLERVAIDYIILSRGKQRLRFLK